MMLTRARIVCHYLNTPTSFANKLNCLQGSLVKSLKFSPSPMPCARAVLAAR